MRNIMGDSPSPSPNIAYREFNTSNVGLLGQPDSAATYSVIAAPSIYPEVMPGLACCCLDPCAFELLALSCTNEMLSDESLPLGTIVWVPTTPKLSAL